MEIIIELSDMARICFALKKRGWQVSGGAIGETTAYLEFERMPKDRTSSNVVDVLKGT